MRRAVFVLLIVIIGANAWGSFYDYDLDDIRQQADDLAKAYLETNNLRDGIEFLGGPFKLEDYKVTVEYLQKEGSGLHVGMSYKYQRSDGITGCPEQFEIWFEDRDMSGSVDMIKTPIGIDKNVELPSRMELNELRKLVSELSSYKSCDTDPPVTIISIDKENQVSHEGKKGSRILKISQPEIDMMQVFLDGSHILVPSFDMSPDVWLISENKKWEFLKPYDCAIRKPSTIGEQRFILVGEMDDDKLLEVIRIGTQVPGVSKIAAITTDFSGVFISSGQEKHNLPFGDVSVNLPRISLILKQQSGSWKLAAHLWLLNILPDPESIFSRGYILFSPKPDPKEIIKLRNNIQWHKASEINAHDWLTEKDLKEICEIMLRIRGFGSEREATIIKIDKVGEISIFGSQVGGFGGPLVKMKKVKDRWIITKLNPSG